MIVQLDLSVAELEKLAKDVDRDIGEHQWGGQPRSISEYHRSIFLNQLRDKLQTALHQARRAESLSKQP